MADLSGDAAAPPPDRGVYGISVAAELSGVPVQSLRLYERHGLLAPARSQGGRVATVPTTWLGCGASARSWRPGSIWPASRGYSTSKMTTPNCPRRTPIYDPVTVRCVRQ